jgi:hypothetical protein
LPGLQFVGISKIRWLNSWLTTHVFDKPDQYTSLCYSQYICIFGESAGSDAIGFDTYQANIAEKQ